MQFSIISLFYAVIVLTVPTVSLLGSTQLAASLPLLTVLSFCTGRPRWKVGGAGRFILVALVLFVAYSTVSTGWSANSVASLERVVKLSAIILIGALLCLQCSELPNFERGLVRSSLVVAFAALSVVLLAVLVSVLVATRIFAFTYGALEPHLNELSRFSAVYAQIAVLAAATFSRGRSGSILAIFALSLAVLALSQLSNTTAFIAIVIGAVSFGLAWHLPRTTALLLGITILVGIAALPWVDIARFLPLEALSHSALHRLAIWEFARDAIAQAPVLGHGLDASRWLPGAQDLLTGKELGGRLRELPQWAVLEHAGATNLPLHPHGLVLQLWLELGAIGAGLFATIMLALLHWIARASIFARDKAALIGLMATSFVIASGSYGAWQSWWVSALFLVAAIGLLSPTVGVRQRDGGRQRSGGHLMGAT